MNKEALFRNIPKVDKILEQPKVKAALSIYPRKVVLSAIHKTLGNIREAISKGEIEDLELISLSSIESSLMEVLSRQWQMSLRPVINATGVVVHTNLGRAPLPEEIMEGLAHVACGYSNLEFDLNLGKRGSRYSHVEGILKELTGAEGAMVVNNNAAAVLLVLDTLAKGKEVIVSRGELIEIGGSFRIPDVMKKSGALLVEVGTTNKTKLSDYQEAITPNTGLILKVHTSNYKIIGFTQSVEGKDMVTLAHKQNIPVMEDLGSGCFVDFSRFGLEKEPTVQEVLSQGVDVVTFSGDKLLGGPQAGIILGKDWIIQRVRKNPLTRALRIDKLTLYCLEAILRIYMDIDNAILKIPTLRMILEEKPVLHRRAKKLFRELNRINDGTFELNILQGYSKVGGGALPALDLPTYMIGVVPKRGDITRALEFLRSWEPPIIVRVERETICLDVRTIRESDMKYIVRAFLALSKAI